MGPDGLEPSTSPLSGVRSNRAELWALDLPVGCTDGNEEESYRRGSGSDTRNDNGPRLCGGRGTRTIDQPARPNPETIWSFGLAPTTCAAIFPSWNRAIVGMLMTPYLAATVGDSSMFSLTTLILPSYST